MDDRKRDISTTTSGRPPEPGFEAGPAPGPLDLVTGQHTAYWVLTPEERAKGFVRPVRRSYRHVGAPAPRYPLRDVTDEERERYATLGYVKFEAYPESENPKTGSFWTQARLDRINAGCRAVTSMWVALAETYARDPSYYGATFCITCRTHLPVNEFVWIESDGREGARVGT